MLAEPVTIREAMITDVAFLSKMMLEAISASPALVKHLGLDAIQQRETQYWHEWLTQPDPAFIAVDANGLAVGAIVLQPNDDGQSSWRIGIGVEADARAHGIGRKLIDRALAFARAERAAYLDLSVDPGNTRAITLYQHMGFVTTGSRNSLIEMRINLT